MVFALCDEEDFLGLLQSAAQLRRERRQEIEKGEWGRRKVERRNEKESDKHSVRRLRAVKYLEIHDIKHAQACKIPCSALLWSFHDHSLFFFYCLLGTCLFEHVIAHTTSLLQVSMDTSVRIKDQGLTHSKFSLL